MSLNDKLAAAAAKHAERQAAIAGALVTHTERIDAAVDTHAVQYLENKLNDGVETDEAIKLAQAEAARHRMHLAQAATKIADPAVKNVALRCANCLAVTEHALTVDHNAETVATCLCGRFRKFAAGVKVEAEQ